MRALLIALLWISASVAPAQAKICPDAPLPRLKIGENGEVASGIDRLRLRALPAVGTGEERLLYAGNTFEVVAGPSCNGGYSWWRVKLANGTTGWVAEGNWYAYYLRPSNGGDTRTICNRAETPWLYLLTSAACSLLQGMAAPG